MALEHVIYYECKAMLKFALGNGTKVPDDIVESIHNYQKNLEKKDISEDVHENDTNTTAASDSCMVALNKAHHQLSKIVAPAKPKTLALFDREDDVKYLNFLGPVSLIRRMMLIAILALITLISLSISPDVNGKPSSFSLTANGGVSLLVNQLFLMSAAAIGASFAALFQVNQYIKSSSYDPMYESTYWVRFVLGILAGTMLATLIPVDGFMGANMQSTITDINDTATSAMNATMAQMGQNESTGFAIPLLALIGGFSAAVVFRILTRLTTAVESIFKGDTKELMNSMEVTNNMKLEQQNIQTKLQVLNQLRTLQDKIPEGTDSKALVDEINAIQNRLMDNEVK